LLGDAVGLRLAQLATFTWQISLSVSGGADSLLIDSLSIELNTISADKMPFGVIKYMTKL
jgi:hypothetical protein